MTQAELLMALTEIFRANFDDATLTIDMTTTSRDIAGWDSAKMVLLILAVEERFNVRFRSKDIDALHCIGDWVALIEFAKAK